MVSPGVPLASAQMTVQDTTHMFFGGFGGAPKSMSNVEDRFPGGNTKQNI